MKKKDKIEQLESKLKVAEDNSKNMAVLLEMFLNISNKDILGIDVNIHNEAYVVPNNETGHIENRATGRNSYMITIETDEKVED